MQKIIEIQDQLDQLSSSHVIGHKKTFDLVNKVHSQRNGQHILVSGTPSNELTVKNALTPQNHEMSIQDRDSPTGGTSPTFGLKSKKYLKKRSP